MANLEHLFSTGQKVRCKLDGVFYKGTVKETFVDHIIVDIPQISDHCWYKHGYTDKVMETYIGCHTYVHDSENSCYGIYNPTEKLSEM